MFKQTLFSNISRTAGIANPIPVVDAPSTTQQQAALGNRRNNSSPPPAQYPPSESSAPSGSHQPESSSYICLSSIINHPPSAMANICQTYSWKKLRKTGRYVPWCSNNQVSFHRKLVIRAFSRFRFLGMHNRSKVCFHLPNNIFAYIHQVSK